jgi:dihydrodipicolinate synthase/N-acetylneuraminate lyase
MSTAAMRTDEEVPFPRLRGVLPVVQTPLRDDDAIDFATLQREVDWVLQQGADGVVMAMVSETLRLDSQEREALAEALCRWASPHGAVIISVGAESTRVALRYARHAEAAGADAVMAIPPVATACGEDELYGYYAAILRATAIPVIVQDASGYVGRPLSIGFQSRLAQEFGPRVMFKPEAPPLGQRLGALRAAVGPGTRIFEGSGGIALVESYRRGIDGTMPGAELVDVIVALWRALQAGDALRIDRLALPLMALVSLQTSLDAFLAVEKYLLHRRGIFPNTRVRGPVGYVLDDVTRSEVDRLFDLLMQALAAA